MASTAYRNWLADGKPKRYGRAVQAVALRLRAHGYTVYLDGNQDHLEHEPPEDHTFFSATGWPGRSPYGYCLAMDIMPPKAGQRSLITGQLLPSLQALSAQLYADKLAGHPGAAFVKYMNWEPQGNNTGPCWHDTWTPDHARRNSSDRGHTHVSSRTDYATSAASDDYDLVARTMGDDDVAAASDMITLTKDTAKEIGDGTKYKEGDKLSLATLVQLTLIYSSRGNKGTASIASAIADQGDDLDEAELAARIVAAIPANLADQVVQGLGKKLAS